MRIDEPVVLMLIPARHAAYVATALEAHGSNNGGSPPWLRKNLDDLKILASGNLSLRDTPHSGNPELPQGGPLVTIDGVRWLSPEQAAAKLPIGERQIRNLCADQVIGTRISQRRWAIHIDDITYIAKRNQR